jgi:RHS repeat-associated protein
MAASLLQTAITAFPRRGGDPDPLDQFVWDVRYVDAPVVRFHDGNTDGDLTGGTEEGDNTLYYTTDANWNVTALVDAATGNVVERYMYDPYGKVTILDGTTGGQTDWATDADQISDVANDVLYAGYRFDAETGLYATDGRIYHPTLGRWLQRDPAGYLDGANLYGYVSDNQVAVTDPTGLSGETAPQDLGLWRGGGSIELLPYLYGSSAGWSDLVEPCGGPAPQTYRLCEGRVGIGTTAPPPVQVPGGGSGNGWKWNPDPNNPRGGSWGPKTPIPGRSQPNASWDPDGAKPHWDVDDGLGNRGRYGPNGEPMTPEEVHGRSPEANLPPAEDVAKASTVVGVLIIMYWVLSELSHVLIPLRNLIPVP